MTRTHLLLLLLLGILQVGIAQKATIYFKITDSATNSPTPAKMVFLKDGMPYEHQVSSTQELACRGNTIYTSKGEGRFLIAPGTYNIYFGKGMEYSQAMQSHTFEEEDSYNIAATLTKELNTDGYIGGDMHLHTYTFSGHGDANVEERLISCVAEGLEWAVATDHNAVLDYDSYMEKLGLKGLMATSIGNEVSTPIGHFNTYPLTGGEPINAKISVGKELFSTIRTNPNAPKNTVIQVNHPRWVETDYFNTKGLDPYFGTSKHPEWDWGFDAFEVLNENFGIGWRDAPDNKFSVKQDWFNMLNHGRKMTGLGNSDSHSVIAQIAGIPRNYIRSSTDLPSDIKEEELIQNIKNQQVIVACGVLPNMILNEEYGVGTQVPLKAKEVLRVKLSVQAASWVSCHKAELIENGEVIRTFNIAPSTNTTRFDTMIILQPKLDSWYSFIAYGDEPMAPLVQTKEKPVYPKGFTNPIWVDVTGDGAITSVVDYSQQLADSMYKKPTYFLAQLRQRPALVIPSFQHLFQHQPKAAVQLATLYLKQATTRQRLMLYRELSKMGTPLATSVLTNEKRRNAIPLEEVVLNYYLEFPISDNKAATFKKQDQTQLDEQLNALEDLFRFTLSGATPKMLNVAKGGSMPDLNKMVWTPVPLPDNSLLELDDALPTQEGTHHYIHYPLFAKMDTLITFYLHTNAPMKVNNNGKVLEIIEANDQFPINGKLIQLPLEKGRNELYFQVASYEGTRIAIQEINPDNLLDASLENAKTVEHLAVDKPVDYLIPYASKYHGHGIALTDGYRGTTNFSSQLWQGWNGENAEFTIDLGTVQDVQEITIGLLADQDSWIFYPHALHCSFSKDGTTFTENQPFLLDATKKMSAPTLKDVAIPMSSQKARYVKIIAERLPQIPEWHVGKGKDAWICIDEVIIK